MEALVVLALVFSPVDVTAYVPSRASERWWDALKSVASARELSGPSCHWLPDFRAEVRWTRRYAQERCDCPSIRDCDRLPPWSFCLECFKGWRDLGHKLEKARAERLHWAERLAPLLQECEWYKDFWSLAAQAQSESSLWITRRHRLDELRTLMGREDYEVGQWPLPASILYSP